MPNARKNNVWCWRWHLRAVHGQYDDRRCPTCMKNKAAARPRERSTRSRYWLWEDDHYEYRWLREQGFTPPQIAVKAGAKWSAFERTLYRRLGGKANW